MPFSCVSASSIGGLGLKGCKASKFLEIEGGGPRFGAFAQFVCKGDWAY